MAPCISNSVQPAWRPVFSALAARGARRRRAGPTVTVRVEGASGTLLERTAAVARPTTPVHRATATATAPAPAARSSGAPAATGTARTTRVGYVVERIRGETHPFDALGDYWASWVNGTGCSAAAASARTSCQEGDEVLFFVDRAATPSRRDCACTNDAGAPARADARPARGARPARRSTVTRRDAATATAAPSPADGARSPAAASTPPPAPTARRRVTLRRRRGQVALKATKAGQRALGGRDASRCRAPGQPPRRAAGAGRARHGRAGRRGSAASASGQRFKRRRAPRTLRGSRLAGPVRACARSS